MEDHEFRIYIEGIIGKLQEYIPDASYIAFNFHEGDYLTLLGKILSSYDQTIDYPRQDENCLVLSVEMIRHFLKSSESWLSLGQKNVLLMHCEPGGWPALAFMLFVHNQYSGEQRSLDMIYKQAPSELLNRIPLLDVGAVGTPLDRALILDCIIFRVIPDMDGSGGCHPIFRIYGRNPLTATDRSSKLLFSTPIKSKLVRHLKQAQCELVKVDINCHVQGDVVLECIALGDDLKIEKMMSRVMFNSAFIRPNILMLNRDEIYALWNVKEQFPKDFRCKIIFSDMDSTSSIRTLSLPGTGDKAGLPVEAFSKVQETVSNVDFICSRPDVALNVIHHLATSNNIPRKFDEVSRIRRHVSESDLVHKANNLEDGFLKNSREEFSSQVVEQLETISRKGAKEVRVIRGLSMGGIEGMTRSLSIEEMVNPAEFERDIRGPSAEIESEVLQEDLIVAQNIIEAGTEEISNCVETSRGSRSSIAKIQELFSPKRENETASIPNMSVSKSEEMPTYPEFDRNSRSSASEIQESHARAIDKQVDILTPKDEKETMSIQSINSAGTEEISRPVELERDARDSTEVEEPQLVPPKSAESGLVLQRSTKGSLSNPTSYCNSLQGLPVPHSRYHGASSVLGISALLSDHFAPGIKGLNAVTLSPRHAVSPSFLLSDKDNSDIPGSTMQKSMTPHLKELRSDSMITPQSPGTPRSQTSPLKAIPPPLAPHPGSMPSTLAAKPISSATRAIPPSPPPPPPPPPMIGRKAISSFMLHESLPAAPQFVTNFVRQGTQHAAPASLGPAPPPPPPPPPLTIKEPVPNISHTPLASSSFPKPPPPPHLMLKESMPISKQYRHHAPPTALPASTAKEPLPNISPHFPLVSSLIPKPPPPPPVLTARKPAQNISPHSPQASSVPKPPPPPHPKELTPILNKHSPPVPPPPAPFFLPKSKSASLTPHSSGSSLKIPPPAPTLGEKGKIQPRLTLKNLFQSKKSNLKPYHWLKLTRAVQGSLWAEPQNSEEASEAPEIDMFELECLFAASVPNSDRMSSVRRSSHPTSGPKSKKVNLIELRRAYNCEIMLTKVKVPLHELTTSILTLDDSALDVDQVENLIRFCPNKEEMELLKNYNGAKENLGKCEQFFLELMKVPRVESKLRVFAFKIQFHFQVSELRENLNVINSACEELKNSVKLKRIMKTILSLGNALNQGTARGSAVGFRLDSLLKLTDTRAQNNKMTLMHYLCKLQVLSEKLPEVLKFPEDLISLEASTKIQLKCLAEEMQAISKGMEKVKHELTLSENEGPVSDFFCKSLTKFLSLAEGEVRSLASLYSGVGRNADALSIYFGEDSARVPFEQGVSTLRNFVTMFIRAHEENCKQIDLEKKKAQTEAYVKSKLDFSKNQNMTITSNLQEHLVK